MRSIVIVAMSLVTIVGAAAEKVQNFWDPNYVVSEATARTAFCFTAIEALGKKTGALQAVSSDKRRRIRSRR